MAIFVSLATCHHCPMVSSRRGLVYRDSLSALSRNFRGPGYAHRPVSPRLHSKHPCRGPRPDFPESIALAHSKPPSNMNHLLLAHLRKLLTLGHAPQRRFHLLV